MFVWRYIAQDEPDFEVINLEFILKLKIKRVRKQPIIALYFEFETVIKLYNLEALTLPHVYNKGADHAS